MCQLTLWLIRRLWCYRLHDYGIVSNQFSQDHVDVQAARLSPLKIYRYSAMRSEFVFTAESKEKRRIERRGTPKGGRRSLEVRAGRFEVRKTLEGKIRTLKSGRESLGVRTGRFEVRRTSALHRW